MSTSLVNEDRGADFALRDAASGMIETGVVSLDQLSGGANSRVFCVRCADNNTYILKEYFLHHGDQRDRLGVESASLLFLWGKGLRNIPKPLKVDRKRQLALYSYIPGEKINSETIDKHDIDDTISFLAKINALRLHEESKVLPPASEAYFSGSDVFDHVLLRLNKLYDANKGLEGRRELRSFLMSGIKPFLNIAREWSHRNATRDHAAFDKELAQEYRILSPSDFGFHNALRDAKGGIHYLDFEYFGWDDPAKTACDFILHPAMALSHKLKGYFITEFLKTFPENHKLLKRIEYLYPLFGLKWCLIMLNEFYPGDLSRREHASPLDLNKEEKCREQLLKSRAMLKTIKTTYQDFPYKE